MTSLAPSRGVSRTTFALTVGGLVCAFALWSYREPLAAGVGKLFSPSAADDPVLWSDRVHEWEVNGTKGRDVTQFKSGRVEWHELPAGEWRQDTWPSLKKLKEAK